MRVSAVVKQIYTIRAETRFQLHTGLTPSISSPPPPPILMVLLLVSLETEILHTKTQLQWQKQQQKWMKTTSSVGATLN